MGRPQETARLTPDRLREAAIPHILAPGSAGRAVLKSIAAWLCAGILLAAAPPQGIGKDMSGTADTTAIPLPAPKTSGGLPVEQALHRRRSVREFANQPLSLTEVGQLLWAAQGITGSGGERTAPSAGALYPLEVYLVAGNVTDLPDGVYRYHPHGHTLTEVIGGDLRSALVAAALDQEWIASAPAVIVLAAVHARTTRKYGERGVRYVHMEAGHAAQNVALQATSLHLGTTTIGAFDDARVRRVLTLPADQQPLYLLPVGKPR